MFLESLANARVALQGFRIVSVSGDTTALAVASPHFAAQLLSLETFEKALTIAIRGCTTWPKF